MRTGTEGWLNAGRTDRRWAALTRFGLWASVGLVLLTNAKAGPLAPETPIHDGYAIIASIPGPDGMWDYAAIGAQDRKLLLAQGEDISILPLGSQPAWTRIHVDSAMWHGVVPFESRGWILGANGQDHTVTAFDATTHAQIQATSTSGGHKSKLSGRMAQFAALADPDAVVVEPQSGLVGAVNGGSGEVVFLDVGHAAAVGRAQVGGKLEFAVADGRGRIYVNVETAHEIAVIDVPRLKVVERIPLPGCTEPKGLAYAESSDLLITACDNGIALFIVARTATRVATIKVGRGADAVLVDDRRHRVFVPSGSDAALSIFDIGTPGRITLLQTLPTEPGTRLGAVDAQTGLVYLPAAKLGPPIPPRPWPSAIKGSFHVLVVGPGGRP